MSGIPTTIVTKRAELQMKLVAGLNMIVFMAIQAAVDEDGSKVELLAKQTHIRNQQRR